MQDLVYGSHRAALALPDDREIALPAHAPNLLAPADALRAALAAPHNFPPLRRALTPDDRVTVALDPAIPALPALLAALFAELDTAGIAAERVTLLLPEGSPADGWPPGATVVVHDPDDATAHALLAATAAGARLDLPRPIIDADQLIILSSPGWSPAGEIETASAWLFPRFAPRDVQVKAARERFRDRLRYRPDRDTPSEIGWLLGMPFAIQVIPGSGDGVTALIAGGLDDGGATEAAFRARWSATAESAELVVATVAGSTMADLSRAAHHASEATETGGAVVLVSAAAPTLGPAFELLRGSDEIENEWPQLRRAGLVDVGAAFDWLRALGRCRLYLATGLEADAVDEIGATPLDRPGQAARLLASEGRWLLMADADRLRVVSDS